MSSKLPYYKFGHLVNNKLAKVYIFLGNGESEAGIKEKEKEKYETEIVIITDTRIHLDDTIETIKKKLLIELLKENINVSFYELYLFAKQYEALDTVNTYQTLTNNGKSELTQEKLENYLVNVSLLIPAEKLNKSEYTYDDFVNLFSEGKLLLNKPVGQKFLANSLMNYVVNPYDLGAKKTNSFLEKPIQEKIITTTNQALLMSVGEIQENIIYFCMAAEVMQMQAQQTQAPETYNTNLVKIYFPFLMDLKIGGREETITIITKQELDEHKQSLMLKTEEMLQNTGFRRTVKNIDLFYDMASEAGANEAAPGASANAVGANAVGANAVGANYHKKGIKNIEIMIYPSFEFSLPLDIIFKLIHATKKTPLIKYNPAKRIEKIYRLYANKSAKNGKKIPYLSKAVILKLMKLIGKKKSVAVYIEIDEDIVGSSSSSSSGEIICNFESNGSILVQANFTEIITLSQIDDILKKNVNPVIEVVKEYIAQSGYNINTFQGLNNPNIEILNIDYVFDIVIEKNLKLDKIIGCLNSVFSISSADIPRDKYTMRFKRVSNYNEMTDQEAFITDSLNHQQTDEDIIEGLMLNFQMTNAEATVKLTDFVSSQNISQKAFKNIKLKNSPGFLTTILRNPTTNMLTIHMSGINDIHYLNTLPIYIDSLIRITQDKQVGVKIKELCYKKYEEEEKGAQVVDIIAATELSYLDRDENIDIIPEGYALPPLPAEETPTPTTLLAVEEISTEKKEIQNKFFNLLFNDDEEEEEEAEEEEEDDDDEDEDRLAFGGSGVSMVNFQLPGADEGADANEVAGADADEVAGAPFEAPAPEEKLKVDWSGKSLTHPSLFFQRLQEREPSLFLKKDEGSYGQYNRSCPWTKSDRRHPVILTAEEKKEIDTKHPNSYENAVEYGSDPKKKFWYICPRYWSLRDNTSLTEEEAKSGKYGKIIPRDAKKIGKDENIYEFSDTNYHLNKTTNEYLNLHPGFQSMEKHPEGKCIPCCYNSWNSPAQKKRRDMCSASAEEAVVAEEAPAPAVASETQAEASEAPADVAQAPADLAPAQALAAIAALTKVEKIQQKKTLAAAAAALDTDKNYIKNAEKFPLNLNQYGYLPISVQKFLHTDNKKCQINLSNPNLKLNQTCFLRHGVESHKSQSFVACIADIWSGELSNGKKFISIREMKQKLIDIMNINIFTTLQNGNLIEIFASSARPLASAQAPVSAPDSAPIFLQDKAQQQKVNGAYENFKAFLRDDTVEINYMYIWDLICQPNKNLFKKGVNLVILEMKNDDITDSLELICPSNHYSSALFDVNRNSIILMKNENYYEPIYTRMDTEKDSTINRTFSLKNPSLLSNIRTTLELIKKSLNEKCGGLPSLPNVYKFEKSILLTELVNALKLKKYTIEKQVVHYNGKTIGVIVSKKFSGEDKIWRGMIPCYPSAPLLDLGFIWMDDDKTYTMPYKETVDFLNKVYGDFVPAKIQCKPLLKVMEDEMIVAVITATNQLITLSLPEQDIYGEDESTPYALPQMITETEYNTVDRETTVEGEGEEEEVDTDRVEFIKKIRLETEFYNVFRNTLRTILGEYKNKKVKEDIEQILLPDSSVLYLEKLRLLTVMLKELMVPTIVEFSEIDISELTTVANCYASASEAGADTSASEAEAEADAEAALGACKLLIPKINLINGQENEKLYFGRIADELLRYSRIKSFIFQPKAFLTLSKLKYNLRDDEIILLQSLLTQDYFKDLIQVEVNPYLNAENTNTYDTAQPLKSAVTYSNKINLAETIDEINAAVVECEKPVTKKLSSKYWSRIFPKDTKEIVYPASTQKKNNICSFELILTLIKQTDKENTSNLTKEELKEILIDEYEKYMAKKYKKELLEILKLEGKKLLTNQILVNQISFEEMIRSAEYYATLLDMWLLAERFQVPLVFISSKKLVENDSLNLVVQIAPQQAPQAPAVQQALAVQQAQAQAEKYFFIKVPAVGDTSIENIPSYKLIFINPATTLIPISLLEDANDKIKQVQAPEETPEKLINNIPLSLADYLQKLYRKNHPILRKAKPKSEKKVLVFEKEEEGEL